MSGSDVYLSVLEQRDGGLRITDQHIDGQSHEFMAGGFIEEKHVRRVMPFDGLVVLEEQPDHEVRSYHDPDYIFRYEERRWRYEPLIRKRKRADVDDSDPIPREKRQRLLQGNIQFETDIGEVFDGERTKKVCCVVCGQKTAKEDFTDQVANLLAHLDLATHSKRHSMNLI
jgi:hypothetical protein